MAPVAAKGAVAPWRGGTLLRRLWLLAPAAPSARALGGPLGPRGSAPEVRPRRGRNHMSDILDPMEPVMMDLDAELLKLQNTALRGADATCKKFDVEVHQLLRNTERNLVDLEEACQTPDGTLKEPSEVIPVLSVFLDREAWLVNATMHSLIQSTRELMDLLPQDVSRRSGPYLVALGSLTDQLMGPVQAELQNLSQACGPSRSTTRAPDAARGGIGPQAQAELESTPGGNRPHSVMVRSLAHEMRSALALVNSSAKTPRPRSSSAMEPDLHTLKVSSTFMRLSEEVITAGFSVMDMLQATVQRTVQDLQLQPGGCGGAGGAAAEARGQPSAAAAPGGAWWHLLCSSVLAVCATAG